MDVINPIVRRWMEDAAEDPEAFWGRAAEQSPYTGDSAHVDEARQAWSQMSADIAAQRR
jgi:hypothetical protein